MDCGDLIAICRVSPGGVLWVLMTSPTSMLVPDHCVREGQHLILMIHEREVIYLVFGRNFQANVTISIINLSHMCAYSAILRLKIINDKSIEAIELSKIPRDIWTRVALSEIIACTDFRRGDVVQRSPISWSYLGYGAYRIYIGEWSDRYGHIYIYIFLGRGQEIIGKTLFCLIFFNFLQSTLRKDVCTLLLMKPAFYFWTYFLFKHLFGFP